MHLVVIIPREGVCQNDSNQPPADALYASGGGCYSILGVGVGAGVVVVVVSVVVVVVVVVCVCEVVGIVFIVFHKAFLQPLINTL